MHVILEEGSRPIKMWVGEKQIDPVFIEPCETVPDIEDTALEQLKGIAKLPFIHPHGIAVMPDVHYGIGATVGSVIAAQGAIIPAAVGVDIGCGMNAVRTSLKASDLPDGLAAIRHSIERSVPVGFNEHNRVPFGVDVGIKKLMEIVTTHFKGDEKLVSKAYKQLGTLGGGNHFIELCLDENQDVWVMLHSGSRGIGNLIGRHFIEQARRLMEKFFIKLPHKDLAYFPEETPEFKAYIDAVSWAQDYALRNRAAMMKEVLRNLHQELKNPFEITMEAINCHHNYVELESHFGRNVWLTRKGAIRAREGDLGIIPGSMGARSFIVRGKGNPDSYHSCSHGAGRRMGRKEAGRRYTVADLEAQTMGVECRKDAGVLDEIPGAYKDIDQVMANQADLVEIVHTLKQVLCVKG